MKLLPCLLSATWTVCSVCFPVVAHAQTSASSRADRIHVNEVPSPSVLPATSRVTSVLPESNQWVFDRARTFIFLTVSQTSLYAPELSLSHFDLDFSGEKTIVPRLVAELKLKDFNRLSLQGRYDVGFVHRAATLSSTTSSTSLDAENADLIAIPFDAGPLLKYSLNDIFTPYIGYLGEVMFYRVSSSLSGAELQGLGLTHGPTVGLEINSPDPDWKLSLLLGYQKIFAPSSSSVLRSGDEVSAGLGWFF